MNKCLIIFVEGATEIEFYKKVVANARIKNGNKKFDTNIEYRNVNGIGGFKDIVLRKFIKEIKPKYDKTCKFTIVLCSDTDVFELEKKPPIIWKDVISNLEDNGADKVVMIRAKKSIEDWFLLDYENILSFLRLRKDTKISGSNGYEKLKKLYKKANKIYYKGMKSNNMIDKLDLDKILINVYDELAPLYKELGVNIKKNLM